MKHLKELIFFVFFFFILLGCENNTTNIESVKEHVHDVVSISGYDATCTSTGLTDGKKCSVCGEIIVPQEIIPLRNHTIVTIKGYDATCTSTGLTDGKKCSVCGEIIVPQEIIPLRNHTIEIIPGYDATSTSTGLTEGKKCSECGEIIVPQEIIPILCTNEFIIQVVLENQTTFYIRNSYSINEQVSYIIEDYDGYNFVGYFDGDTLITDSKTIEFLMPDETVFIYAYFELIKTKYTVNHYKENPDGSYPIEPSDTEILYGIPNDVTEAKAKEYDGYKIPLASQKLITPDGLTIINIYYKLIKYNVHAYLKDYSSGSISGLGNYLPQNEVTLKATINDGYKFLGWYDEDTGNILSESLEYSFIVTSDIIISALTEEIPTIKYILRCRFEGVNGEIPDSYTDYEILGTSTINSNISLKDFDGFYLSSQAFYGDVSSDETKIIIATYKRNRYNVIVRINYDNEAIETSKISFVYGYNFKWNARYDGYDIVGFFENDALLSNDINYSFEIPNRDVNLELRLSSKTFNITLNPLDASFDYPLKYNVKSGETITFNVPYKEGYIFKGWINDSKYYTDEFGKLLNTKSITSDLELIPLFINEDNAYTLINDNLLAFGIYPQTLIDTSYDNNLSSISFDDTWLPFDYYDENNERYMFYKDFDIDFDGIYDYRGIYFTKYKPFVSNECPYIGQTDKYGYNQYNNGYFTNNMYFFKYEPIIWKILLSDDEKIFIVSSLIIESTEYQNGDFDYSMFEHSGGLGYPNNYSLSYIRSFINDKFLNLAFDNDEQNIINVSLVDNGSSSYTDYYNKDELNEYVCQNTYDKLFLLSYFDIYNYLIEEVPDQIIPTDIGMTKGTDYAKCLGLKISYQSEKEYSSYWLRSPDRISNSVHIKNYTTVSSAIANETRVGVRIGCYINIEK